MTNRLAIIPARSGSKRIPNKNIKLFFNKPIISYVIKTLQKSKLFNEIHISTNSKKIKNIVESNSIKIPFLRPKYLSKDNTPLIDVLNFVLKKFATIDKNFDEVWLIYSTAVLLDDYDLKKASRIIKNKKIKNILSVSKFPAPIEWALNIKNNKLIPLNNKKISRDSKLFSTKYYENASFIIYKLKKNKYSISKTNEFFPYILSPLSSIDIDDKDDWELAKKIYKTNEKKNLL
tara:strand:+ start:1078 stop:1776 length:699 start_codon:yes stop_codon:yes gene_type:complete